mmetsp:Transcript_85493/g.228629  ORF Transcript_85493/g.228629 Transcript_85493/m.228629 type:complete len:269 (-) Transcript_85493:2266-3072(-)
MRVTSLGWWMTATISSARVDRRSTIQDTGNNTANPSAQTCALDVRLIFAIRTRTTPRDAPVAMQRHRPSRTPGGRVQTTHSATSAASTGITTQRAAIASPRVRRRQEPSPDCPCADVSDAADCSRGIRLPGQETSPEPMELPAVDSPARGGTGSKGWSRPQSAGLGVPTVAGATSSHAAAVGSTNSASSCFGKVSREPLRSEKPPLRERPPSDSCSEAPLLLKNLNHSHGNAKRPKTNIAATAATCHAQIWTVVASVVSAHVSAPAPE